RAVLGTCAGYWMFSFVSVIGLYGKRRDYALGGMVLAGVVSLLLFWVQVYPYVHLRRNWPDRLVAKLETPAKIGLAGEDSLPAALYLFREGWEVKTVGGPEENLPYVHSLGWQEEIDTSREVEVAGWSGMVESKVWVLDQGEQ
ncbi:MAG: hypothetical protein KDC54_17305, partial [Lewinella sp.]|nr:hypothetical protein [Lewinella sp.]